MNIRVFIVRYHETDKLYTCLENLGIHDGVSITIINNRGTLDLSDKFPHVNIINNYARPDWSTGKLARNWNETILHGFEDLNNPACDKVISVQADARINPEWYNNILNISPEIKFMSCGHGDEFLMFTPEGIKKVGMFDERFSSAFHEVDYYVRCKIRMPENTCIIDRNAWSGSLGWIIYNKHGIDDTNFILGTYKCGHCIETQGGMHYHNLVRNIFNIDKYGIEPDDIGTYEKYISHSEYIWYPYFEHNIDRDVYIHNNKPGERVCELLDTYIPPSQLKNI
jgi:hypothetical protein